MGKKGRKGAPTLLSTQLITGRLRWAKCVHFIDGRDRGNQELSDPRASFLSFFVVRVSWTHNSSSFHHLARTLPLFPPSYPALAGSALRPVRLCCSKGLGRMQHSISRPNIRPAGRQLGAPAYLGLPFELAFPIAGRTSPSAFPQNLLPLARGCSCMDRARALYSTVHLTDGSSSSAMTRGLHSTNSSRPCNRRICLSAQ